MKLKLTNVNIFLLLLSFCIIVLLLISQDSYLHNVYPRVDSAIFFMCGKAWMNGMIPYIDFTDSKGPLLWLIYGVGYLIDHYSYVGVYWLSCINYAITLFFCYKASFILTKEKKKSIFIAMFMIIPFFLHWFHDEVRAEDFCQPFMTGCLYFLIKIATENSPTSIKQGSFFMGFSLIATLLIKWTTSIMLLGCLVGFLHSAYKQKEIKTLTIYLIGGGLTLTIPFLIYFYLEGNFSDFINEYFINTYQTVNISLYLTIKKYILAFVNLITTSQFIFIIYLGILSQFYKKYRAITIYTLIFETWCLLICLRAPWPYYITICSSFALFFIIYVFSFLNKKNWYIMLILFCFYLIPNIKWNIFLKQDYRKDYYAIDYLMSQVENPKIINEGLERGLGLNAHTLPGTKYWFRQNGETPSMRNDRLNAIKEGKADFILYIKYFDSTIKEEQTFVNILKEGEYKYYCSIKIGPYEEIKVYGKPGYKTAPETLNISNSDILFKRNIITYMKN